MVFNAIGIVLFLQYSYLFVLSGFNCWEKGGWIGKNKGYRILSLDLRLTNFLLLSSDTTQNHVYCIIVCFLMWCLLNIKCMSYQYCDDREFWKRTCHLYLWNIYMSSTHFIIYYIRGQAIYPLDLSTHEISSITIILSV